MKDYNLNQWISIFVSIYLMKDLEEYNCHFTTVFHVTLLAQLYKNSNIAHGITLHSFRQGETYYRCFEASVYFRFQELMLWCRCTDSTKLVITLFLKIKWSIRSHIFIKTK